MKTYVALCLCLCLLLSCSSAHAAESKFEPLVKDALATLNKLADTLERIKDSDTAKKAEQPLNEAVDKLLETQKKLTALGKPSEEEQKQIKDKYEAEMKKGQQRLQKAAMTAAAAGPEAQEIVKKALEKLQRRGR